MAKRDRSGTSVQRRSAKVGMGAAPCGFQGADFDVSVFGLSTSTQINPWANLQSIAATTNSAYTGCTQESGFAKTADANNQFTDFGYDLSGNTTGDGVNTYTWNAESQMKTA